MILRVNGRQEHQKSQAHENPAVFQDVDVDFVKTGNQRSVLVQVDLIIENQHQRRQHQNHGGDAQQHALRHDDANVPAQRQPHEAQGQKARDGGQAAAGKRGKCRHNGLRHGVALILVIAPFFLISVVKEDGVVHGNA
ncbi:hypothetical protein SDC9_152726 [bioreactor metagenome]|uniref:Uncharacterized protein n=1 Tax=bioreactor metagenome TaxID=1076179 RepID=A0A645ETW6_9ZZZZ